MHCYSRLSSPHFHIPNSISHPYFPGSWFPLIVIHHIWQMLTQLSYALIFVFREKGSSILFEYFLMHVTDELILSCSETLLVIYFHNCCWAQLSCLSEMFLFAPLCGLCLWSAAWVTTFDLYKSFNSGSKGWCHYYAFLLVQFCWITFLMVSENINFYLLMQYMFW